VWDSGIRCNYRAGFDGADDLKVLDNAPAGGIHAGVRCRECMVVGLHGFRWSCSLCRDHDLCNSCYVTDKHRLDHAFFRQDTPTSQRVRVTPRARSRRIQAKGVYAGATVVRGLHWSFGNIDGGSGNVGVVKGVREAVKHDSWNSHVTVAWRHGATHVMRRGHMGMVDIKYTRAANGELYYVDHLPTLREHAAGVSEDTYFEVVDDDDTDSDYDYD